MKIPLALLMVLSFCGTGVGKVNNIEAAQAQPFHVLNPQIKYGDVLITRIAPQWQGSQIGIYIFGEIYLPNKYGEVFVGIDATIQPGKHPVFRTEFGLIDWSYHEEVEVAKVEFPPSRWKPRNVRELEQINKALESGNSFEKYADGEFIRPLDKISLDKDRVAGDVVKAFGGESHRGVDLRTLNLETKEHRRPVKAINSGKVVMTARNFSLEGNMVIIDHGSGIFSLYMHLSRIDVKIGDLVKTGQFVGISGKSGNASGPHLHWAVKIRNADQTVSVDPLIFIDTINQHLR